MFSYHQAKLIITHKYALLLAWFIIALVFYPISFEKPFMLTLLKSVLLFPLLGMIYLIQNNTTLFKFTLYLSIIIIIFSILDLRFHSALLNFVYSALLLTFYIINIAVLLKDITHQRKITQDVILGSLCVYIMIGIVFAGIYVYLLFNDPNAFRFHNVATQTHLEASYNLVYFSFTTLATVGYGDIVPQSFFAKGIVILEEITGLFYLAVLVSRLVATMKAK